MSDTDEENYPPHKKLRLRWPPQSSINDLNCEDVNPSTSSKNDVNKPSTSKKQKLNSYIIHEADETNTQILTESESDDCDTGSNSSFIDNTNYETSISFYQQCTNK